MSILLEHITEQEFIDVVSGTMYQGIDEEEIRFMKCIYRSIVAGNIVISNHIEFATCIYMFVKGWTFMELSLKKPVELEKFTDTVSYHEASTEQLTAFEVVNKLDYDKYKDTFTQLAVLNSAKRANLTSS